MTAIIVILFCIAMGPIGWFWLLVGGGLWLWMNAKPSESDPFIPVKNPYRAESDLGNLNFNDASEWERGEDSFTNRWNGVTFTRSINGNWEADDDDGSGNNSEYYGWYHIED